MDEAEGRMIPDLGLMIGAYIIVRMVSFLLRTGERRESILVKILAVIAILVTVVCTYDLIAKGAQPYSGIGTGIGGIR